MMKPSSGPRKAKALRPVHPNAGLELLYRRKLWALIREMHDSVVYWVKAAYRKNEPEIAQDELPAATLEAAMRKLIRQWQTKFDDAAPALAEYFARAASDRSGRALRKILLEHGITVEFKMTRGMQDMLRASVNENVGLIKSIPRKYLADVQGAVMRSVQTGRDLGTLTKELQRSYGVTKRRAGFIARDQNNKATAAMTRGRQVELGITEAVWMHSGGGKHPRPTHVKAGQDRARYDVREGWYDPAVKKTIFPGELPNCRCVSRSVVPGFL